MKIRLAKKQMKKSRPIRIETKRKRGKNKSNDGLRPSK